MCGIAGIFASDPDVVRDWSPLEAMRERLHHRGPDDRGTLLRRESGIGLAHTRLSIIDLSAAGRQPMCSADGTVALVFNGEIFNFRELRRELERDGASFRTHTDTEVILHGYRAWGIDVVRRLNGMFAMGLWDERERTLWLVRDRLGKKPLYYWHDEARGLLVFGSEIKALLCWPFVARRVDPAALHCYLSLSYVPPPRTMFAGISKLAPAHSLRIDRTGHAVERYWQRPSPGCWEASPAEYRTAVRRAVESAVERRLVSDVPLGAFLSGGVDSTITVGVMSQAGARPVRTFSAAFDVGPRSAKYNVDADAAAGVSRHFGAEHTRLTIDGAANIRDRIAEVVWHMDEPQANPTFVSTYLLAQAVKGAGITVALSGDGSDELFGGYSRYGLDRAVSMIRRLPAPVRAALEALPSGLPRVAQLRKILAKARIEPLSARRYLTWWEQFGPAERMRLLAPAWQGALDAPERAIEAAMQATTTSDDREFQSSLDLGLWIPEDSNMRLDKMGMAHALEVRVPFLDYTVVELASSIPFTARAGRWSGKRLLKEAFSDLLPAEVVERPKWGWISPHYYWLKDHLWDEAQRLIRGLPDTGLFAPEVTALVADHPPGDPVRIWALMIFAWWHERFIAGG